MREFSSKPEVTKLEIVLDGKPVYVRSLMAGDKVRLADMQGELAALASKVKAQAANDEAESLGEAAQSVLSKDQYKAWVAYMYEEVFLRLCDGNGKRRFDSSKEGRKAFDALPSDFVEAVYSETHAVLADDEEDAEKNS